MEIKDEHNPDEQEYYGYQQQSVHYRLLFSLAGTKHARARRSPTAAPCFGIGIACREAEATDLQARSMLTPGAADV